MSVVMGGYYRHRATDAVMRCYAGSAPDLNDYVKLISPKGYGVWRGDYSRWEGTWSEFADQWEQIPDPQLSWSP